MKNHSTLKALFIGFAFLFLGKIYAQAPCNANWSKQKDPSNFKKYYFTAALNDTNYKYLWTFGDNTSSDSRLTFHTYATAGKYRVCLKVTKKDSSCTQTICDSINIETPNPCNANWTKQNDPSNNKKVYFSATLNDTNFKYLWTFGDGTSSDSRLTFRNYLNPGKYYVCLKVMKKDSSCQQTKCDSISVGSICNASFSKVASNTLLRTYLFEANTNDTNYIYKYTFGDSSAASFGRFTTHTYANNGTYTVCLTVTRKDSTCTQTQCQTLTIGTLSTCNANFNIVKSDSVGANPHYVRFINTSTGTHTRCIYNFGDGTSSDNCNPLHHFTTLGSKTVCLTIYNIASNKDTLCKSTTCKTFTTGNSNPIACVAAFDYERIGNTSSYSFVNKSAGTPLQYLWVFDGVTTATTANVVHNYITPGWHTVCLYVRNMLDTNCVSSFCVNVMFPGNINQQQCAADFSFTPDSLNAGRFQFTSFSGNAVVTNWNFGDGTFSQDANGYHTYLANGTYNVCLSVLNSLDSCSDMRCESVVVSNATGLASNQMELGNVYPNPVDKFLHVTLDSKSLQNVTIRIIDFSGRTLLETTQTLYKGHQEIQLNMEQLQAGLYFLHIQSGEEKLVKKIMK